MSKTETVMWTKIIVSVWLPIVRPPCNEHRQPQASGDNGKGPSGLPTATLPTSRTKTDHDSITGSSNKTGLNSSTSTSAPIPIPLQLNESHHPLPNAVASTTLTTHYSREESEHTDSTSRNHISNSSTSGVEVDGATSGSCNVLASNQPVCILCDEPATVRLLPCGHEIICLMCSKRAKKCLQCKVGHDQLLCEYIEG